MWKGVWSLESAGNGIGCDPSTSLNAPIYRSFVQEE
jgi:hypothetical protein